jgi:hypothetical protein
MRNFKIQRFSHRGITSGVAMTMKSPCNVNGREQSTGSWPWLSYIHTYRGLLFPPVTSADGLCRNHLFVHHDE